MPYFNRFDIVLAHYVFCIFWHHGPGCRLYRRMNKISRYLSLPEHETLDLDDPANVNARAIYEDICRRHGIEDFSR